MAESSIPDRTGPIPVERIQVSERHIRPLMIAHRCGANLGPENTCAAAIQSSFYRPDYYEIDIRHTLDGVAVCLHDSTLDRTTDASGDVTRLRLEEIDYADAGAWAGSVYEGERIPTLEKMLDSVNPSPLAIELKESDITLDECKVILELLNRQADISSVVMSFSQEALDTWHEAENEVPREWKSRTVWLTTEFNEFALGGEHDVIGLLKDECTEQVVNAVHEAGKAVWVWTVNEGFEKYMMMHVDGIVTDNPDKLRAIIPPS